MDLDTAVTGGFNLQIAYGHHRLAGRKGGGPVSGIDYQSAIPAKYGQRVGCAWQEEYRGRLGKRRTDKNRTENMEHFNIANRWPCEAKGNTIAKVAAKRWF